MIADVRSLLSASHGRRSAVRLALVSLALGIFSVILGGCGGGAPLAIPVGGAGSLTESSLGESDWAQQVLELTNAERAAYGLAPLQWDERAARAAYEHAWDMHLRGFFAHVNPDGEDYEDRLARHVESFEVSRENLARGHGSPEAVVEGWMASPDHRANILYPGWTHVGIAVHTGSSHGPWWAQEFFR